MKGRQFPASCPGRLSHDFGFCLLPKPLSILREMLSTSHIGAFHPIFKPDAETKVNQSGLIDWCFRFGQLAKPLGNFSVVVHRKRCMRFRLLLVAACALFGVLVGLAYHATPRAFFVAVMGAAPAKRYPSPPRSQNLNRRPTSPIVWRKPSPSRQPLRRSVAIISRHNRRNDLRVGRCRAFQSATQ